MGLIEFQGNHTVTDLPMLEGTRNFDYDEMARRIPGANPTN